MIDFSNTSNVKKRLASNQNITVGTFMIKLNLNRTHTFSKFPKIKHFFRCSNQSSDKTFLVIKNTMTLFNDIVNGKVLEIISINQLFVDIFE